MSLLAPTLQAFFAERLIAQRQVSPHTISSYRDTIRLLLAFAQEKTGRAPSRLQLEDLDAPLINAFLEHVERERGCSARTRNTRLSALRSLFAFAALRHPEHAALIARVLAIPPKRTDKPLITFLTEPEAEALLASPDQSRWLGRRDHALLLLAIQTGLRVSELAGLALSRRVAGTSCLPPVSRERQERTHHTSDKANRRRVARLADRARRRARTAALPNDP
jgi:site-specific recombinase XerD